MNSCKALGSVTLFVLAGCMSATSPPVSGVTVPTATKPTAAGLTELANLNYSNGQITVFSVSGKKATKSAAFTPGAAQGLAMDARGRIYTTVTSSSGKPCAACVEIFTSTGHLVRQLDAPVLKSASGAPSLTDVSVDSQLNVYVSDYGQQAVYYFPKGNAKKQPVVVVQNSTNAATVLATPNGANVVVSGGCGFASVRPYERTSSGYQAGSCFGIGTIALIGGAVDDGIDVMTPVDGALGLVSVSSPSGGNAFSTPDQKHAEISGVALSGDATVAYVANHKCECVYAFAQPAKGWLSGQPKLLATYRGFSHLDIIAVAQ